MKLTKELVLTFASGNSKFKTSGLVAFLRHGVSRQYTSFFLNELVKAGDLVREGAASATFYALPENLHVLGTGVRKRYKNNELKEHEVLEELQKKADKIINWHVLYRVLMELQADNKVERLESIQNPGNYVTFSPEFSNKTIWKKVNLINQIVYKAGFFWRKK